MKLDNDLQFSKNQLEKLNDTQRNLISSKQKEIDSLDKMYDEKKINERYVGEAELLDIRDRNQSEIAEQLNLKQQRLSNIKKSFDDSKMKLDQEKEILTNTHKQKIEDLNSVYDNKYKDRFSEANSVAEEINDQTHQTIRQLESQTNERISQSTFENKLRADEKSIENTQKLADQEKVHNIQQNTAVKNYSRKSAELMMEHEDMLLDQNYKQLSERNNLQIIHQRDIENKTEQHKDLLLQEDKSFKQKYEAITTQHRNVLERIKDRFSKQISGLVNSQMKTKSMIENKSDDDFYKIKELNPTLTDLEDSYEISLDVPEHEKENVRLTAHNRDITLSLTRKFSDSVESEDGSQNQSSRSEIFKKKITSTDLLNSREITQNYNEGRLTFNIKKL